MRRWFPAARGLPARANRVSLKMHTHRYRDAKKIRVTYEMREKD
jgi:hypothetical protein